MTEPLGDSLLLECMSGDTTFKVEAEPRTLVEHGETVELACHPDRLHLFDAETGQALYHSDDSPNQSSPKPGAIDQSD